MKAVARGETAVGISFVHDGVTEALAGFPVKTATPCEGTGYEIGSMSIIKGARNLANAKKFYDWALTPEAQKLAPQAKQFQVPSNKATPLPPEAPKFADMKLIDYDQAKYGKSAERKRLIAKWDAEVGAPAQALMPPCSADASPRARAASAWSAAGLLAAVAAALVRAAGRPRFRRLARRPVVVGRLCAAAWRRSSSTADGGWRRCCWRSPRALRRAAAGIARAARHAAARVASAGGLALFVAQGLAHRPARLDARTGSRRCSASSTAARSASALAAPLVADRAACPCCRSGWRCAAHSAATPSSPARSTHGRRLDPALHRLADPAHPGAGLRGRRRRLRAGRCCWNGWRRRRSGACAASRAAAAAAWPGTRSSWRCAAAPARRRSASPSR